MKLSIAKRLYLVSGVLTLMLLAVAVSSWFALGAIAREADQVGQLRVLQLQRIAQTELNVTRVSLQLRHAMLIKTPEGLASTLADAGEKRKIIDDSLAAYEKDIISAAGKAFFAKAVELQGKFWVVGDQNIQLIKGGQLEEAFAFLVDKTIPARNELLQALDGEKKRQAEQLASEVKLIRTNAVSTRALLAALATVAAAGLMAFSWYVSGVLRGRIGEAQAVAEHIRDGDLAVPVHDGARDEVSPLLAAMAEMRESLGRLVSSVRTGADSVSSASVEISSGNNDLSARTEQQANALQETAASMEQLSSTVRQNADNARQANQLAMSASTVAERGGAVVGQVVETMKGIHDSSNKIADIISVIDGIAFQTNILALNAAVEAARAGEQGRGCAVGASEVRSLAGRSAEAAKQIKTLITDSVERVGAGSALVDQAGATMTEVVGAIRRVTDLMGEISAASTEQSQGVSQVGEAVTQMDQATQQNAALVEEMAAAASALNAQAGELVNAVAVFKLDASATTRAPASPAARAYSAQRGALPTSPKPGTTNNIGNKTAAKPHASLSAPKPDVASAKPKAQSPAPATAPATAKGGDEDWESF